MTLTRIPAAALALVALSAVDAPAAELEAPFASRWSIAPDLAVTPYSDAGAETADVLRGLALGVHGTRRWARWGLGLGLEATSWKNTDARGNDDVFVALHAGLEGEVLSAGGRVRTRVGGGLAVLLEGTTLDSAGATGFYLDLRPAGVRWSLAELIVGLDPVTLSVTVPDAGGIPLVDVQYRFCLYAEFGR